MSRYYGLLKIVLCCELLLRFCLDCALADRNSSERFHPCIHGCGDVMDMFIKSNRCVFLYIKKSVTFCWCCRLRHHDDLVWFHGILVIDSVIGDVVVCIMAGIMLLYG